MAGETPAVPITVPFDRGVSLSGARPPGYALLQRAYVYGDLGQLFAWTAVAQPRLAPALMGMLVKGLGPDRNLWGTDSVWTGAPQWQIEGLRRLEMPDEMQKKHGFKPLGPADGPLKTAVFSGNSARLYGLDQHAEPIPAGPVRRDKDRV